MQQSFSAYFAGTYEDARNAFIKKPFTDSKGVIVSLASERGMWISRGLGWREALDSTRLLISALGASLFSFVSGGRDVNLTVKDALELYENGKHRRYGLLFSVNGGAFAIAKILAGQGNVLGGLSLKQLSIGMALFTLLMVWDIFEFGRRNRKEPIPEVFGGVGKAVLLLLGFLICAGWMLVGFGSA